MHQIKVFWTKKWRMPSFPSLPPPSPLSTGSLACLMSCILLICKRRCKRKIPIWKKSIKSNQERGGNRRCRRKIQCIKLKVFWTKKWRMPSFPSLPPPSTLFTGSMACLMSYTLICKRKYKWEFPIHRIEEFWTKEITLQEAFHNNCYKRNTHSKDSRQPKYKICPKSKNHFYGTIRIRFYGQKGKC